jgi:membrane protein implicated in regulation of membrane protease activity
MAGLDIWVWAVVIAVSLILEFISMEVTSIWFSIGGLTSLILAATESTSFEVQVIVFIVTSAVLLLTLRRWTKNKLLKSDGTTNIDLVKTKKFKLLTPITKTSNGTLKYNGVVWTAVSADGKRIKAKEWVVVTKVQGNKLIVKKAGKK